MDIQDIQGCSPPKTEQAGTSSEQGRVVEEMKEYHSLDVWNKIRHGHVPTAMRLRSLLLFVASTIMSYLEAVTVTTNHQRNPSQIMTKIVAVFINSEQLEPPISFNEESFLDTLFTKFPGMDVKGMHYHEVYLSISPMITNVNWARMKFDRSDAMKCYRSLAGVLHVCFEQAGMVSRVEADQLFLSIYVVSVWCSIVKRQSELSRGYNHDEDFETFMKMWIFHSHFENFSKVFVASCCEIMEISERLESSPNIPSEFIGEKELPQPISLTPPVLTDPITFTNVHPSWQMSSYQGQPTFDMAHGSQHFSGNMMMFPNQFDSVHHYPPPHPLPFAPKTTKSRRKSTETSGIPSQSDSIKKPRQSKKGPKPGTKYRERITLEASMILRREAATMANFPNRYEKREISRRTNISLYQVKSFFNRVTAERKRIWTGKAPGRCGSRRCQLFPSFVVPTFSNCTISPCRSQ